MGVVREQFTFAFVLNYKLYFFCVISISYQIISNHIVLYHIILYSNHIVLYHIIIIIIVLLYCIRLGLTMIFGLLGVYG